MPACKICKKRIDVSVTGVRVFKCRICKKPFCESHFVHAKDLCLRCAGYSEEKIAKIVKKFSSFTRE